MNPLTDILNKTSHPTSFSQVVATARAIQDFGNVHYPDGITSPKLEMNIDAKNGKFVYDREFLLQFMPICQGKPDMHPQLDDLGLNPFIALHSAMERKSRGHIQRPTLVSSDPQGEDPAFKPSRLDLTGNVVKNVMPIVRPESSPRFTSANPRMANSNSSEIVRSNVKGLLDKLDADNFHTISGQIIQYAEVQNDAKTLVQIVDLIFEHATNGPRWSEIDACLCRCMVEKISPQFQKDDLIYSNAIPVTGGQLFRTYLVCKCQDHLERGWKVSASSRAMGENLRDEPDGDDIRRMEQYYAARRRGLGLVTFTGELFKQQMITERIMHECIKGFLANPEEEDIESLCTLLETVGSKLDTPTARAHMDVHFSRMQTLVNNPSFSSRVRVMIQDVIELRGRRWVSESSASAPMILTEIPEVVARDKVAKGAAFSAPIPASASTSIPTRTYLSPNSTRERKIRIKTADGQEVDLGALAKQFPPPSPRRSQFEKPLVRLESEDERNKRISRQRMGDGESVRYPPDEKGKQVRKEGKKLRRQKEKARIEEERIRRERNLRSEQDVGRMGEEVGFQLGEAVLNAAMASGEQKVWRV